MKIKEIVTTVIRGAKELASRVKVEVVDSNTIQITLKQGPKPKNIHIQLSLFDEEEKK